MSEQARLLQYYPGFEEAVVNRVAEVAEQQRNNTWDHISRDLPENKIFFTANGSIELMDIVPSDDYDETWVYHLPMGNPLADHMQLRIATLAATEPNKRIIGIGNPSGPRQGVGKLPVSSLRSVWSGDLRPTIDPVLQYLSSQQITTATHIGFSYGAEKAAAAAQFADRYDQSVPRGLFMEPVALKERGLLELGRDFNSTAAALEEYVNAADSAAVVEAGLRAAEKSHGMISYMLGLLRASNIAIAHALTKDGFEERANEALTKQDQLEAHLVWGSESELAIHSLMINLAKRLKDRFGDRVITMELESQKHAMGDDVFLHTAMVLQSLSAVKP